MFVYFHSVRTMTAFFTVLMPQCQTHGSLSVYILSEYSSHCASYSVQAWVKHGPCIQRAYTLVETTNGKVIITQYVKCLNGGKWKSLWEYCKKSTVHIFTDICWRPCSVTGFIVCLRDIKVSTVDSNLAHSWVVTCDRSSVQSWVTFRVEITFKQRWVRVDESEKRKRSF